MGKSSALDGELPALFRTSTFGRSDRKGRSMAKRGKGSVFGRWLLCLGLVLTSFLALFPPAQAAAPLSPQQARVSFAAVYNGEILPGDVGPLWSTLVVQNLEAFPVEVRLRSQRIGGIVRGPFTLAPRAVRTFTATELGGLGLVPSGQSAGLIVEAEFTAQSRTILKALGICTGMGVCNPAIAAVEKHSAPIALGNDLRTTAASRSVSGSTGLREEDWEVANQGRNWVLPVVQTNSNWRTVIKVANLRQQQNEVTVTLERARGVIVGQASYSLSQVIGPAETWTIDLAGIVPPEWVGAAFIDADLAGVAVVAERYKAEWRMLLTNEGIPRSTATVRYAPVVFRNYNNWNTGITIVNLDRSNPNTVTLTYYDRNGVVQVVPPELSTLTLEPGESAFIYRPDVSTVPSLDPARVNAVVVNGSRPLAVAVDEVKYLAGPGQGQAMSYVAPVMPDVAGQKRSLSPEETQQRTAGQVSDRAWFTHVLALPLFQVGDAAGQSDVSGFTLFNPTGRQQQASIILLSANGAPVAPSQVGTSESLVSLTVPPGGYVVVYPYASDFGTTFTAIPSSLTGTALVGVTDGTGSGPGFLVGMSNVVNYQVQGDGSAVFLLTPSRHPMLTTAQFTLRLQPAVTMAELNEQVRLSALLTGDNTPLPNRSIGFRVAPGGVPTPTTGSEITNASGRAPFTFTNTSNQETLNSVTVWWDLNGNGQEDATEPTATSTVHWVTSVSGTLTLSPTSVSAGSLGASNDDLRVSVTATCDLDPNDPTGVQVLFEFEGNGSSPLARWVGGTIGRTGVTSTTSSGVSNIATATLILEAGVANDTFTVRCYLDYGATGVLESGIDVPLDSRTINVQ